jgi:hypothetical protein
MDIALARPSKDRSLWGALVVKYQPLTFLVSMNRQRLSGYLLGRRLQVIEEAWLGGFLGWDNVYDRRDYTTRLHFHAKLEIEGNASYKCLPQN